ncbi:hypothetical protein AJ79_03613 [Helicocarpus griseus UAMH5409]|uniref:Uncharacterized protein n=1 Tax=Helicocarpus griseus UAMH5409 TaxID=1447875 RepID=A0A2B7XXH2_9EURO|nr:hypothetical protein AJ79_03613 [Helicocarpus griseus UAMH5409]
MAGVPPAGFPMQHPQAAQAHAQAQARGQPMPYYPNPNNPYPPQTRAPQIHHQPPPVQHGFGPVPLHPGAAAPSMMMSPGLPHHSPGLAVGPVPHPNNFSNPQYMQSIPATVAQSPLPQSPSTQNMISLPQSQPQVMASIAASNPPFSTPPRPSQAPIPQQQQQQQQIQSPVSALSPQQAAREKARVTVLLDINSALLQEVVNLQASGKAGITPNQPASQQSSPIKENNTASPTSPTDIAGSQSQNAGTDGPKPTPGVTGKPSIEYIDCMRRLQANLAYLATVADRAKKTGASAPQAPAIMTPPPNVPGVTELYAKLNELFAGVSKQGGPSTPQQQLQQQQHHKQRQSQGPQPSPQGNGTPAHVSPAEMVG